MTSWNSSLMTQRFGATVSVAVCVVAVNILVTEGASGLLRNTVYFFRKLPFVNGIIAMVLKGEVSGAAKLLAGQDSSADDAGNVIPIPEKGVSSDKILKVLDALHSTETASEDGRAFAYTYTSENMQGGLSDALRAAYETFTESSGSGSPDHEQMLKACWSKFMHTNALNPIMYPSLKRFENEVVAMVAWMLHGDGAVAGALTSGGTESILMAVKAYRDRARVLRPHVSRPNMVVPITIHPAFEKAAHYFGVDIVHVKVGADCRVLVAEVERAIDSNTILIVGSAPQYCHAVIGNNYKLLLMEYIHIFLMKYLSTVRAVRVGFLKFFLFYHVTIYHQTPSRRCPSWPCARACLCTWTRASAASCCPGWRSSASSCRCGTSACPASPGNGGVALFIVL
jgi:sphinganine-1-phosphate aldolase